MSEATDSPEVTRHQFYFETPLYEVVKIDNLSHVIHSGDVEAYSVFQKSPTTYSISYSEVDAYSKFENFKKVSLTNKRTSEDILFFFVYADHKNVVKVGQLPSLASLQLSEIDKKYSKQLDDTDIRLFKKAIGLSAHGVGAGSFVYLRRIFEGLILSAYEQNASELAISGEDFKLLRMTEKVDTLKKFLPSELVEMKSIYAILSKGVHELSEEECLVYFAPLKLSIELILDQKIEEALKVEKARQVKSEIEKISASLKAKPKTSQSAQAESETP
jgi:hypothetical protein